MANDPPSETFPEARLFRWGEWLLYRTPDDNDVSLWFSSADWVVIEVVGDSNGWWQWGRGDLRYSVWSVGTRDPTSLYHEPWDLPLPSPEPLPAQSWTLASGTGLTTFEVSPERLVITLTDQGVLTLDPARPHIAFHTYDGRDLVFSANESDQDHLDVCTPDPPEDDEVAFG